MKGRLCLHGVGIKHQRQLLDLVKQVVPSCKLKYRIEEKYLADNDMYKYRSAKFQLKDKLGFKLTCNYGALIVKDKIHPIADVIFTYDQQRQGQVVFDLAQRLLASKLHFLLEEPDLELRIDQLRGKFRPEESVAFDASSPATVLSCYVPCQIYGLSAAWYKLLQVRGEKSILRQVRVKLRRLRSLLKLVEPLVGPKASQACHGFLKEQANLLSSAREYDVMLQICARLKLQPEEAPSTSHLEQVLTKLRNSQVKKLLHRCSLNQFTGRLLYIAWELQQLRLQEPYASQGLEEFLGQRLSKWQQKLVKLLQASQGERNMERLHRLRIKIKRFRYGIQGVQGFEGRGSLRRGLKNMQDLLGLLHDEYINTGLLTALAKAHPEDQQLQYQVAMFCGWEQARAAAALDSLDQSMEELTEQLDLWRQDYLV